RFFVDLLIQWSEQPLRNVIVSGRFGTVFARHCAERTENLLLVKGDLRRVNDLAPLDALTDRIRGRRFVFFDDSYYSGSTRTKVETEIERLGGWLDRTYVLYDGAHKRSSSVF